MHAFFCFRHIYTLHCNWSVLSADNVGLHLYGPLENFAPIGQCFSLLIDWWCFFTEPLGFLLQPESMTLFSLKLML